MASLHAARAAVVAAAAAYLVSLIPGVRSQPGFSTFWDLVVNAAVILGSAAVCAQRARLIATDRAAWACISAGLGSYGVGTIVYFGFLSRLDEVPYPSLSDGLWLMLYPLAIVGVGLMVRARMAGSVLSMWLDGLVSGLGLVSVSAALVFPRVTAGATGPPAAIVTNFAYPFLDLVLVATVVGAMAAMRAWRDRSWLMLGAGFLVFATADSWYLLQLAADTYPPGSPVDATYHLAGVLIALAAGAGADEPADLSGNVRTERRSFLVPGASALVAVAVLAIGARSSISLLGLALAVGALIAAWGRTALAVREVVQLSDSRRQARTDALTGLPNRRAFYELLDAAQAAAGASRSAQVATILLIDLDRFKEINDALGHQVGDEVLAAVSQRFTLHTPAGGTLARLGGDELAVFVPAMQAQSAATLARTLLDALTDAFVIDNVSLHLDASIGITVVPLEVGVSRALAQADLAMYRAKESRSGFVVYDEDRDGNAWDRLATVEDLREALSAGGLTVHYQPIVDLGGLAPVAVEALVRWRHPTRGWIRPDEFLPLAERAGLMSRVTRTVLAQALNDAKDLRDLGWPLPVSVNLSASDLLDVGLVDDIASGLESRGLRGESLRIEITESLLVDDATSSEFLCRLRALGIDLAVDDFGTGYSCMAYLHQLPLSHLKIDRGFTDRLLRDERTAVIVDSTIQMAHGLSLAVVAEGVESAKQLEWLQAHGCDLIQGYHISRPMEAAHLREWLSARLPLTFAAPAVSRS